MFEESTFVNPVSEVYRTLCRPYLRAYSLQDYFGERRIHWITGSPLVSRLLSEAAIWSVDCTYNEIVEKGETYYLMNVAFYCDELDRRKSKEGEKYLSPFQQN